LAQVCCASRSRVRSLWHGMATSSTWGPNSGRLRERVAETTPLAQFSDQLKDLLRNTIEKQTRELDERERAIAEREQKFEEYLRHQHSSRKVVMRVGQEVFYTASDVLLSQPDTYFHGMLNPEFRQEEDGTYFIARDGQSFGYVLEYLTYGELHSSVDAAHCGKLRADADFYGLPGLREAVDRLTPPLSGPPQAMWQSTMQACHNSPIKWNVSVIDANPSLFTLSEDLTQITVNKGGTFLVFGKVSGNPNNGSVGIHLYQNASLVDTVYGTSYEGSPYPFTYTINSVVIAKASDTLSVKNLTGQSTVVANSPSSLRLQAVECTGKQPGGTCEVQVRI